MRPETRLHPSIWNPISGSGKAPFSARGFLAQAGDLPAASALKSLQQETDPEIFFHSVYRLACDFEYRNEDAAGAKLLSALASADPESSQVPSGIREEARRRLQAKIGAGGVGYRLEYQAKHFFSEALSPASLIGMTGASALGRALYGSVASRLAARSASFLTRGWAAQGLAGASALVVEAPAYGLLAHGARSLSGAPPSGDLPAEMGMSSLMLGAMKLTGGLTRTILRGRSSPWLERAASFGGILAGQEIIGRVAGRGDDPTRVSDALLFFLHAQIGSYLSGKFLGMDILARRPEGARRAPLHRSSANISKVEILNRSSSVGAHGVRPRRISLQAYNDLNSPQKSINAYSLGSDTPLKASKLWEPPPDLVTAVPLFLLPGKQPGKPPATELNLSLPLPGLTADFPSKILMAGSFEPPGSGGRPPNDPPHDAFAQDALAWASKLTYGEAEAKLVEALLHKIRHQMRGILNHQSGTRLAHRIATGKPIALRLTPQGEGLSNYSLELLDSPKPWQPHFDMVQIQLDPGTGTLTPLEYLGHVSFEIEARQEKVDIRHGFIPFYRKVELTSPALSSRHLLPELPRAMRAMVEADQTFYDRPPTAAAALLQNQASAEIKYESEPPDPPPLLVTYRPLIFEGTRIEVDRYADYQIGSEEGRQRLHHLTQHILAVLHERESKIELPENSVLKGSPGVYVIVKLNPEQPSETKIEVLTMEEAVDRNMMEEIDENEVLLFLLRAPWFGGEFKYPHLEHHRLRPTEMGNTPTGADLAFENYLGLKNCLHMRWDVMDIQPRNIKEWDDWMAENGYFVEKSPSK